MKHFLLRSSLCLLLTFPAAAATDVKGMSPDEFEAWILDTKWTSKDDDSYHFIAPGAVVVTTGDGVRCWRWAVTKTGSVKVPWKGQSWSVDELLVSDDGTTAVKKRPKGKKTEFTFSSREKPESLGKGKLAGMDTSRFREWLIGTSVNVPGKDIDLRFLDSGVIEGFYGNHTEGKRGVFNIHEPGLVTLSYGPGSWITPTLIFSSDLETVTLHTKWFTREDLPVTANAPASDDSEMPDDTDQEIDIAADLGDLKGIPIIRRVAKINALLLSPLGHGTYAAEVSKFSITALATQDKDPANIRFNQSVGKMMSGALKEVVRMHAIRQGGWPRGAGIELAFAEKYSSKDGLCQPSPAPC